MWADDLTDMQLTSKYNERVRLLLSVINSYSKYTYVAPFGDKKSMINTNAFQTFWLVLS